MQIFVDFRDKYGKFNFRLEGNLFFNIIVIKNLVK